MSQNSTLFSNYQKNKLNHIPLNQVVDTHTRTKFLYLNKQEILNMEIKNIKKESKNSLTLQNRKKIKSLETKKLLLQPKFLRNKKNYNIIGVDEGLISLPNLTLNSSIKFLTNEEIAIKNHNKNITLNNYDSISNYIQNFTEENPEEKFEKVKFEENEIKKLNNWDIQHAFKDKNAFRSQSFTKIAQSLDPSSLKWMFEIKQDPKKLQNLNRIPKLKEFFTKIEEEQSAIFNQNMNVNKKQFDFNVFEHNNNDNTNNTSNFSKSSIDFYRDLMRDKIKVEEYLKIDLANLCQELFNKKTIKKNLSNKINKIINEINQTENKKSKILDKANKIINKIQKENYDINNYKNDHEISLFFNKNIIQTNIETNSKWNQMETEKKNIERKSIDNANININNDFPNMTKFLKQKLISEINKFAAEKNLQIDERKVELKFEFESHSKELHQIEDNLHRLKVRINNRVIEHRKYFFEILKKGIDVRKDGLSWCLVRLIELKSSIEISKFPKFLNTQQIQYLSILAYKQYELMELMKLFTTLKNQQKILREKVDIDGEKNKIKKIMTLKNKNNNNNNNFSNFNLNNVNIGISNKFVNNFENLANKFEGIINMSLTEMKEEKFIEKIIKQLHAKISVKGRKKNDDFIKDDDEIDLFFLPGSLVEFFKQNKKFRDLFDDIYYLNAEIIKREKEISKMKKDALENFKESNKIVNKGKNSIETEMAFAALFGNGILI